MIILIIAFFLETKLRTFVATRHISLKIFVFWPNFYVRQPCFRQRKRFLQSIVMHPKFLVHIYLVPIDGHRSSGFEGSWRRFFGIPGAAMLGFVFFMFLEVPRHTRGCSIAFAFWYFEVWKVAGKGFSAYPGLLLSLRFLMFSSCFGRFIGIPAAAR